MNAPKHLKYNKSKQGGVQPQTNELINNFRSLCPKCGHRQKDN